MQSIEFISFCLQSIFAYLIQYLRIEQTSQLARRVREVLSYFLLLPFSLERSLPEQRLSGQKCEAVF